MKLPLEGVRILDLAAMLPGHFATQLLADMGADVIKVERIGGDMARHLLPGSFEAVNRNKRSIAIDLKADAGKAVFRKLVATADAMIESFRPGVTTRIGVDYEACLEINPRIVYVSISGYGQDGPYAERGGFDKDFLGIAGHLSLDPLEEGFVPETAAIPISDYGSALYAALAVLTGLRGRDLNGVGQYVDCSATDAMVSWMSHVLVGNAVNPNAPVSSTHGNPVYGVFKTKDDRLITLSAFEDSFWQKVCRMMGRDDWAADASLGHMAGRIAHAKEIRPQVEAFIARHDRDEILRIFNQHDVPGAHVNTVPELPADPHIIHRQLLFSIDHPTFGSLRQVAHPLKYHGTPAEYPLAPPLLGEHTNEILASLGYTASDISSLNQSGVIQST